MENTLQITNGKITLNGVPVHNVSEYSLEPFYRDKSVTEVKLVFNVDNISVGESIDQSVDESPTHQPETHLELTKLIDFAMKGVEYRKQLLEMDNEISKSYNAFMTKKLADYEYELTTEYVRLTNG